MGDQLFEITLFFSSVWGLEFYFNHSVSHGTLQLMQQQGNNLAAFEQIYAVWWWLPGGGVKFLYFLVSSSRIRPSVLVADIGHGFVSDSLINKEGFIYPVQSLSYLRLHLLDQQPCTSHVQRPQRSLIVDLKESSQPAEWEFNKPVSLFLLLGFNFYYNHVFAAGKSQHSHRQSGVG